MPINYLRNVAFEAAHTNYVFFVDVDFIPMPGSYGAICERIPHMRTSQVVEQSEFSLHF